jgi:Domain of unknown function (DUF3850)
MLNFCVNSRVTDPFSIQFLKTIPEYFQLVHDRIKTFEFRKNDRNFQVGDVLVLYEWDDEKSDRKATGRAVITKPIQYILKDVYGLDKINSCIIQIEVDYTLDDFIVEVDMEGNPITSFVVEVKSEKIQFKHC